MGDISKDFSMYEFINSNVAKKYNIDNSPSKIIESKLIKLVNNILQPLRNYMGVSCTINSGYRCPQLNSHKDIKGAVNSSHLRGTASDITFGSREMNKKAFLWIRDNCKFTQLIWEKGDSNGPQWIHIDYDESNLKSQVLTIK